MDSNRATTILVSSIAEVSIECCVCVVYGVNSGGGCVDAERYPPQHSSLKRALRVPYFCDEDREMCQTSNAKELLRNTTARPSHDSSTATMMAGHHIARLSLLHI